jgi:hypothetical protein
VFANLYEYKRGNVSKDNLDKAMQIGLAAA